MSDPTEVESYVTSLKVVELKDELKKRHLSYVGNKQVLAQRLREDMLKALQQDASQVEEEEEEEEEEGKQDQEEQPPQQQQQDSAVMPPQEEVSKLK